MSAISSVFKKELNRVFKDKKLMFSMFLLPPLLVIIIYGLISTLADNMESDIEAHNSIVYMADAPASMKNLVAASGYDQSAEVTYISAKEVTDELKQTVLDGGVDLIVVFPADFEEKVAGFGTSTTDVPTVQLYYNSTKNYSQAAYQALETTLLPAYRQAILADRLGDLNTLIVFHENTNLIVNEDEANGQFLAMMVPYLVVMMLFASAMGLCVDATAGEKERGTLASLLMTPAKRSHIALGKLLGLSTLAGISAILYAVGLLVAMPSLSFGDESLTAGSVSFSPFQIVAMMILLVVLVYLFVALISLASILAKDVKTASTLVSPMYIVVILLGMSTMFQTPGEAALGMYAIPIYGTSLAIQNIMINALTVPQLLLSIAGELVLAIAFTFGIQKAFDSEKVVFNA